MTFVSQRVFIVGSGGDLENDERIANLIYNLITLSDTVDPAVFPPHSAQKISIDFEEFNYTVCLSNKKIYVVKRRTVQSGTASMEIPKDSITL